jgi:hypothetical protein
VTRAIDLLSLSRDVARVEERRAAGSVDPFETARHVSTQSTYRALAEATIAAHEEPIREGLARWVYELLQARVGDDLAKDEADSLREVDERFAADPPAAFESAHRALVVATSPVLARAALARLGELAAPVAAVRKERRARREEVARRLDLDDPFALATGKKTAELRAVAKAFLDATNDLAEDLRRRAKHTTAADAIHALFARDANQGWPAHLGGRWLEDAFRALVTRPFPPGPMPVALGAASFLRAGAAFGRAMRNSGTARSLPFVLARDPYADDAHRFGALLAMAMAGPIFQRRKLGLSARAAAAQSRLLASTLLGSARVLAVRFLLASHAPASVDPTTFEEHTVMAFGAPLPRTLANAWPDLHVDEASRLRGALEAHAFERSLVDRFDEDWFDNPRAAAHLGSIAAGPVFALSLSPLEADAPRSLGRHFERAIG